MHELTAGDWIAIASLLLVGYAVGALLYLGVERLLGRNARHGSRPGAGAGDAEIDALRDRTLAEVRGPRWRATDERTAELLECTLAISSVVVGHHGLLHGRSIDDSDRRGYLRARVEQVRGLRGDDEPWTPEQVRKLWFAVVGDAALDAIGEAREGVNQQTEHPF